LLQHLAKTYQKRLLTADNHPEQWIQVREAGLYCIPADTYIDPWQTVENAIITHGHADHARAGHENVWATPATMAIMRVRYGEQHSPAQHHIEFGERIQLPGTEPVFMTFYPAGHILGSAQVLLEYRGARLVMTGDYKRTPDPSCEPFEAIPCDVFITEATFGLPVFQHPPIQHEIQKLLSSLKRFPERTHLIGVYALGKCQRVLLGLREAGYTKPIYLHGAMLKLVNLYQTFGFDFGECIAVNNVADLTTLAGEVVLAPPSALTDRWSRKLPNVLTCMASGWMQIRARTKQKGAELPLMISDHCDWKELLESIAEVNPQEVWVTHGREDALMHQAQKMGYVARALRLVGYDDE